MAADPYFDTFTENFKHTELLKDVRYVKDGNMIITSGVSTGIDGAIAIMNQYTNPDFAEMVSRGLQYETEIEEKWPTVPAEPMNHGDGDPIN